MNVQALVHELEVVVVRPDVRVLDLLTEAVACPIEPCGPASSPQVNAAHVVRRRVERRVDVDEVDGLAESVSEEVAQDLLVVAVEDQPAPRVGIRPVPPVETVARRGRPERETLDLLCRQVGDVPEWPLAHPCEQRSALGFTDLDRDGGLGTRDAHA